MFEKLKEIAGRRRSVGACTDASVFGDPLALETSWHPAASGGASFGTHRLKQTSAHRVEFAPTAAWKLFSLAFFVAGSGVLVFHLNRFDLGSMVLANGRTYAPMIFGAVFSVAGVCMWWFGSTPRVFDRGRAMYWRGRGQPAMMSTGGQQGPSTPLSTIHALQLLSEYVSGDKNSYYSYELNLVLTDGNRINVVDHGNLENLRADARTLSRFLDRPIWDATRFT